MTLKECIKYQMKNDITAVFTHPDLYCKVLYAPYRQRYFRVPEYYGDDNTYPVDIPWKLLSSDEWGVEPYPKFDKPNESFIEKIYRLFKSLMK